jgi:hypothetical protein
MTKDNLIELATYRVRAASGLSDDRSEQREIDRYQEAIRLLEKIRTTKRISPSDRPLLARNLGRMIIQIDPEHKMEIAERILQSDYWQKRKRYIRFSNEDFAEPPQYAASGGAFAGIVQRLIEEKVRKGYERGRATIDTVHLATKGTLFRRSSRLRLFEASPTVEYTRDSEYLAGQLEKVVETLAEEAELAEYFELVSKYPIRPSDSFQSPERLTLRNNAGPNDLYSWIEWADAEESDGWVPWWSPKCVIGHLYVPLKCKYLDLPQSAVNEIKRICGGEVVHENWEPVFDDCLAEIEPYRESAFVHEGYVLHRLPVYLVALPTQTRIVLCLYISIQHDASDFQIYEALENETYPSYVTSTTPCFVDRVGRQIDGDAEYFSGDNWDASEPLYVCPYDGGIHVIGSGVDESIDNFSSDVFSSFHIPDWLQPYPIQLLLKLTRDSDTALAFALTAQRWVASSDWRGGMGEDDCWFRPSFSDSLTTFTQLRPNTIAGYLLRNFTSAQSEGIFEVLKSDARIKFAAATKVIESELSKFQEAFDRRYDK